MKTYALVWGVVLAVLVSLSATADWIRAEQYGQIHLVVGNAPGDIEAADVFQDYWRRCTGQQVSRAAESRSNAVNIYIGRSVLDGKRIARLDLDTLPPDGIVIRTEQRPAALILAGQGERGTLYSVYEFFERYLGVRWLAPGVTHVPSEPPRALPRADYRYAPPFAWRENSFHHGYNRTPEDKQLRSAHKMPADIQWMDWGGHNLYVYLPPEEYFATHPEYYAEIDGKRTAPHDVEWRDTIQLMMNHPERAGQLCFTNPDVSKIIAERVLEKLRAKPDTKIVNVSQMDWGRNCECVQCRAMIEREGSDAGALLMVVNAVADRVAVEFPDVIVQTFAYLSSVVPPRHITPRPNVAVQFAPIGSNYALPMGDRRDPRCVDALRWLRKWGRISTHLHGWEYVTNFSNPNGPHPNLYTIQPNFREFARAGTSLMFAQGWSTDPPSPSEFLWLRAYIVDKALWNPEEDGDAHVREFVRLYYGAAAPYMQAYIDLMREWVENMGTPLQCFDEQYWLRAPLVRKAQTLFEQALAAAENDTIRARVEAERLPLAYAALVTPPEVSYEGTMLKLERPPSVTLDEYVELLKKAGARERPYEGYFPEEYIRERCEGVTPSRLAVSPIIRLENAAAELWVAPDFSGAVVRWRDKASGAELLNAWREGGAYEGRFEDWNESPKVGTSEFALARRYAVAAQDATSVVLTARTDEGIALTRTLRLDPSTHRLDVEFRAVNDSNEPRELRAKLHPEFALGAKKRPIYRIETNGTWSDIEDDHHGEPVSGGLIEPVSFAQWSVRLPESRVTIRNRIEEGTAAAAFWYYDQRVDARRANMELIVRGVLEPAASRVLRVSYEVGRN